MEALGLFENMTAAAVGADALIQAGFSEEDVFSLSASAYPEGVLAKDERAPFFHWIALAGGVVGAGIGFLVAAGTAWLYPLYTGDKPIISLFPVGIITYEFTMLFAILGTMGGMFLELGLPRLKQGLYDPDISRGFIGVCVNCRNRDQQEKAQEIMKAAGAVRTRREED